MPVSKSKRSRYTPPPPKKQAKSPLWLPSAMFAMFACGLLVVIVNYTDLLPGGASNAYLFLGLVLITGGFGLATQLR